MNRLIIKTKLFIPVPRTKVVERPQLIERLNEGLDRKLTLVSASAGFGKTTLVAEWATGCDRPAAWLSLDEGDNEAARFLTYLIAALNTIMEGRGKGIAHNLESQQMSLNEATLTALLNEIAALPYAFVLVLDDYHLITAKPIDDALVFLLEHQPPQMHLVIATREEPQLPLGRLRAGGHLSELHAADLRFTTGQAAAFMGQVMGVELAEADIQALESRTEGWIAGLQLAALSMQGREDVPAFVRAFAGDNRHIADYLVEEVLRCQPEPIRNFLLHTSILDRLHGPLCDAVADQEESGALLEALERGNFFLVPLDDKRQWYRYHHLFGEVLYANLKANRPGRVASLHRRASEWYERHGSHDEAIRHALAADDFEHAADLIEQAWPLMRRNRRGLAVLGWLRSLPDELIRLRPVLSVEYAWALMAGGKLEAVEERLRDAERWLEMSGDSPERRSEKVVGLEGVAGAEITEMMDRPKMVVRDEEEYRHLPATIAGYRAARAQVAGDIPAAVQYARQVLELVPEEDHLRRGAAAALLGLAAWTSGDLETAYRMFADGMVGVRLAGNISDAIEGTIALGDIRISQGRLRQAMRTYEQGLSLAVEHGGASMPGLADIYAAMSEVCLERNELQGAQEYLQRSKEWCERTGRRQGGLRWHLAMARLLAAQGDLDGACSRLQEAERMSRSGFFPDVRPVSAWRARIWLMKDRVEEAFDWVRERGLSAQDDLNYLREYEHITLARVWLSKYRIARSDSLLRETVELLNRLLLAAEEGGRTGSVIEVLILQALAHYHQGDLPAALVPLERALTLADTEGYFRIFIDEGEHGAALLEAAMRKGVVAPILSRLAAAFGIEESPPTVKQPLLEPLSERELEVLRLFRTELSGPEIARELYVSLHTLRSHTKNIYSKLEVNNRRAAVRRAEELELLF